MFTTFNIKFIAHCVYGNTVCISPPHPPTPIVQYPPQHNLPDYKYNGSLCSRESQYYMYNFVTFRNMYPAKIGRLLKTHIMIKGGSDMLVLLNRMADILSVQ